MAAAGLLLLAVTIGWGAAFWHANRNIEQPSLAQHQRSFQRGVAWLHANEAGILQEGNVALWWMLQTAANVSQDPYLNELVAKSIAYVYQGSRAMSPWRRMLDPTAPYVPNPLMLDGVATYQRFYYHATTCEPLPEDEQGRQVQRYFTDNTCRPMFSKVLLSDTVCSTHQFMGLSLYKRARCQGSEKVDALQRDLLQDIDQQLRIDPVFRDAYIQRVLVLQWFGDAKKIKPAWQQNVLDAQQPDGGWNGERQFVGAPSWLQPWVLRGVATADLRALRSPPPLASGFHATAQGVLLEALAIKEAGGASKLAGATP